MFKGIRYVGRVRPEQAAAGVLDEVPVDLWPRLAARWLAKGFDSGPLRQLAALQPGEAHAALDLMPVALRSIGFDPAVADDQFVVRCQAALDVVQRDLDVTGFGRYRVHAGRPGGWPVMVFAVLPDGSYWSGAWGMTRQMNDAELLLHAAGSVSGTIEDVHEIEWPVCAVHGDDPATRYLDGMESVDDIDGVAWWWCTRAGHGIAQVGRLTGGTARTLC